jgi:L-cystine uptake protein TcyP (sodium:dicarboxylate symporter family)
MDVLLSIIIAIVVFGVFLGVARFAIKKWFPEFMEYFQVIVWVALAALFIYLLIAVWPFLTGAMSPHHSRSF